MLGLRHLNLNVSNLERSVSFYTACFGLVEIERCEEAALYSCLEAGDAA